MVVVVEVEIVGGDRCGGIWWVVVEVVDGGGVGVVSFCNLYYV